MGELHENGHHRRYPIVAHLHVIFFLIGTLLPISDPRPGERLLWSPNAQLSWDHFKGHPDHRSKYAALTKIDMSIAQGPLLRRDSIELIISTELMTDGSWVKPENRTPLILVHEQGHFDIAEYHARRLRKELQERSPMRAISLDEDVNVVFDRIFEEKQAMQQAYDHETDHSIRMKEQLEWQLKIGLLLDSLSAFSDRSVILGLH